MQPIIDIALPGLDQSAALPWALSRLPSGARAIVVDNGSVDGSPGIDNIAAGDEGRCPDDGQRGRGPSRSRRGAFAGLDRRGGALMQAGARRPSGHSLRTSGPPGLCADDGRVIPLDVARWLAPVDTIDATVLNRCTGPVLDVGCGPGRFVHALAERGTAAMGLDIAETAIALTRGRGLPAVLRSVFAPIPGEGRWPTVLLMDGNIGIGGDPCRLLERVHALLAPTGRLIVETHPDAHADVQLAVRFSRDGHSTDPAFAWAHVGLLPLLRYAGSLGFGVPEAWAIGGRTFASLPR